MKCEDCVYFRFEREQWGRCHRYPKQPGVKWPQVKCHDFCGEYEAATPEEEG